jgi:hypothetical protein
MEGSRAEKAARTAAASSSSRQRGQGGSRRHQAQHQAQLARQVRRQRWQAEEEEEEEEEEKGSNLPTPDVALDSGRGRGQPAGGGAGAGIGAVVWAAGGPWARRGVPLGWLTPLQASQLRLLLGTAPRRPVPGCLLAAPPLGSRPGLLVLCLGAGPRRCAHRRTRMRATQLCYSAAG